MTKTPKAKNSLKLAADQTSLNATTHGEAPTHGNEALEPDLDLGALGNKLRELYGSWLNEPVPDRFEKLLKELDHKKPDNS